MTVGFDIISDLHLSPNDSFNWENKATSLYCIVAGNVSSDVRTIGLTLSHLSKFYQGVFYIMGSLEYHGIADVDGRTEEILRITKRISNVAVLYHHVVIIDGIAILGANCWYGNADIVDDAMAYKLEILRTDDIAYLKNSIEKLQRHLDVTKILLVTNSVPGPDLYFGEVPDFVKTQLPPNLALYADTQAKVTHWVFGTHKKIVDTTVEDINYVNNPYYHVRPYWSKRIEIKA